METLKKHEICSKLTVDVAVCTVNFEYISLLFLMLLLSTLSTLVAGHLNYLEFLLCLLQISSQILDKSRNLEYYVLQLNILNVMKQ